MVALGVAQRSASTILEDFLLPRVILRHSFCCPQLFPLQEKEELGSQQLSEATTSH